MNDKGIFSLVLLLTVCSVYFAIIQQAISNEKLLNDSVIKAMKSEKADFIREEISINLENSVKHIIKEAINAGIRDPFELKTKIVEMLVDFFAKIQQKNVNTYCFILDNVSGERKNITKKAVSELISANIINKDSYLQAAEISMHAGKFKNLEPTCEIKLEDIIASFKIPGDYALEVNLNES